ncbi:SpoIIE family protein phosphatase [Streptomyces sp. 378]|uniref:SpoIIE family protein phosphatase n=1 Tax=Streptomyces sp. 378 TaxID=3049412 RepID=UPI0024C2568C|nr:SpoIIE family protein phosphatase [Streptomyces sp. 378]MDK1346699.1 SpoIIE family protein phosphatase [Streptomyces sp. 378]
MPAHKAFFPSGQVCNAQRVTSEPVTPAQPGGAPDLAELAKIVARQRAELDRLRDQAATSAVVERAKGAVMALTGCTADAAGEQLLQRAKAARHTLLEECWITLGGLAPAPAGRSGAREAVDIGGPGSEATALEQSAVPDDVTAALARLGKALVRVMTPHDLARCLLEHLGPDMSADAVLIYARRPDGGLGLIGHAGVDDTLAAQWGQVPPLSGMAALDALRAGEPRWLEDFAADERRYLLIGDPSDRWRSRAWLPVLTAGPAVPEVCIGVLRGRAGAFTARDRAHLRGVTRLCAGRLRAFDAPPERSADAETDAVQALFEALPVAAMLLTPLRAATGEVEDFRVQAATDQVGDLLGRTGEEPAGRRLLELRPALAAEPLWRGCLRVLATGQAYEGEPFAHEEVVAGVAELSLYTARAAPLGDALVVSWIRHGSSDRQEQRLADLQRLGNLGWANWNLVTQEASWSTQVFSLVGRDPAHGPVGLSQVPELALPEDTPALTRAVDELLHQGRPFDVPFRIRTSGGIRHLRLAAEAVADRHGTPVEVHGFVQDMTARRRAELALVESERAILTQHDVLQAERTLASRLQHALLPLANRPVHLAGLRVEVAYLPAQSGVHVGGDWFSAIELPDGDALLVVGDVAGHGVDAVATMAQLRFTAKGMVITGSSLTGALARLNTLLLHSRDSHASATMVLARYNPRRGRLVWAQAGHPPPLLLRDGEARYLRRPAGMLLGATATSVYQEAECRLDPGDRLILYTDGLVEHPPDSIDRGLERLAEAVAAPHGDGPGSLGPLLARMLPDERRDDVCVVDVRVPGGQDQ